MNYKRQQKTIKLVFPKDRHLVSFVNRHIDGKIQEILLLPESCSTREETEALTHMEKRHQRLVWCPDLPTLS